MKDSKDKLKDRKSSISSPKEDNKLTKTKSKDSKKTDDILNIVEEFPIDEPKASSPKEDKKSSKTSSGWGVFGSSKTTTSSKSTKDKEKEKKDKEAADAFAAAMGDDPGDILDMIDEAPPKKSSSKDVKDIKDSKKKSSDKTTDKLSKTDSKSSKKSDLPPMGTYSALSFPVLEDTLVV